MKPSICIVSHNAYGAISGGKEGFVGGVERQTSMLAKWLASEGHQTSIITWNEGGPYREVYDHVRVIKVCGQNEGMPLIRFVYPKWTSLERALREADADIYYHNCSESVTGQVAWWCSRFGRRFVFALASDADWNPSLPEMHKWHEKFLYRFGLRNADSIICQTVTQQQKLKEHWNLDSTVVSMPCPRPAVGEGSTTGRTSKRVLWIGRVCPVKRLEWLLEIAKAMPSIHFDLVGPFDGLSYANDVLELAKKVENVEIHGRIAKEEVWKFYRQVALLCCTSSYEGFPNTFLEAWSRGVPVVSTFDPDGVIECKNLGCVAKDVNGMVNAISELMEDETLYCRLARNASQYYEKNHTFERVMPKLRSALQLY